MLERGYPGRDFAHKPYLRMALARPRGARYSGGMTNDFQDWIGRRASRHDGVTQRLIDAWRAMLSPHLFTGPGFAGLHWALAPPLPEARDLGPDGAERKGAFLPPIPLPRRMWAGGAIESFAPFSVGGRIERHSTLSDLKWREGRSGRLCLASISHEFLCEGSLCVRERQDLVFREPASATEPAPSPPRDADLVWRVDLTPVLLFRFSALTFNSHRIHYDHPYAVETEGYAGLVTHGPLQAALLFNQAACLLGHVPRRFDYRCVAPLIAGQHCEAASRRDGHGCAGWIRDSAGVITCEATAVA